ncbi:MAG: hypothetical protein WKF37_05960 [Bryobacteraceae bacterium]
MPLRIAIDIRNLRDFGIGTYTRNLVQALARIDQTNHYILAATTDEAAELQGSGPTLSSLSIIAPAIAPGKDSAMDGSFEVSPLT